MTCPRKLGSDHSLRSPHKTSIFDNCLPSASSYCTQAHNLCPQVVHGLYKVFSKPVSCPKSYRLHIRHLEGSPSGRILHAVLSFKISTLKAKAQLLSSNGLFPDSRKPFKLYRSALPAKVKRRIKGYFGP